MADTGKPDATDDSPSLEMPSFSLRRRRKKTPGVENTDAPDVAVAPEPAANRATTVLPVVEPDVPAEEPTDAAPRPRRELPTIALSGLPAAAVTGVAVGALAVLLTWLATSACDVVRGTSSCGGGPGLVILAAVLVLVAYAGSLLLQVFAVADAGSTSVLAVGILAVLVLVFLLGSSDEWWMVFAIPVAAAIAFCASWWVTTAVVDESGTGADEPRESP